MLLGTYLLCKFQPFSRLVQANISFHNHCGQHHHNEAENCARFVLYTFNIVTPLKVDSMPKAAMC